MMSKQKSCASFFFFFFFYQQANKCIKLVFRVFRSLKTGIELFVYINKYKSEKLKHLCRIPKLVLVGFESPQPCHFPIEYPMSCWFFLFVLFLWQDLISCLHAIYFVLPVILNLFSYAINNQLEKKPTHIDLRLHDKTILKHVDHELEYSCFQVFCFFLFHFVFGALVFRPCASDMNATCCLQT